MPIATPEVYNEMLNRARDGKFAYPAINVTSSQTLSAALRGFADAESDGIIQVSVGGAEYWSGSTVKDRIAGSLAMAAYAREVAKNYDVTIALHTDHCAKQNLDSWTEQLMHMEAEEVKAGRLPWFQSHMWDGSAIPLDENLEIAKRLLQLAVDSHTVLEIEVGAVGGEEDGVVGEINEKLYTSTADAIKTVEALGLGEKGRVIFPVRAFCSVRTSMFPSMLIRTLPMMAVFARHFRRSSFFWMQVQRSSLPLTSVVRRARSILHFRLHPLPPVLPS